MSNKTEENIDPRNAPPPSEMMKKFVYYYLEGGMKNASEAARRAGSKAKPENIKFQARDWLNHPWVQGQIELHKKDATIVSSLSVEEVIEKLRNVYDQAMIDGKYDAANRAAIALGDYQGMFITQIKKEETKTIVNDADTQNKIEQLKDIIERKTLPSPNLGNVEEGPIIDG